MPQTKQEPAEVVDIIEQSRLSMNQTIKDADSKKPYEPPKVTTISLRPEEAVLGHCKTSGSSFPGLPCAALVCSTFGS